MSEGAIFIQVGRTTDHAEWRMPWRPEWRTVDCDDCGHTSWISPKGLAVKAEYPSARVVCSQCWPRERIEAEMDTVTEL